MAGANGNQATMRRVLIGGIGIITLGIIGFAISGYPPKDSDVSGTIGTAEKYRTTQITDGDVVLDNTAIHSILQNDAVVSLLKNENFRKCLADDHFRASLASEAFRQKLVDVDFSKAFIADAAMKSSTVEGWTTLSNSDAARQFLGKDYARALTPELLRAMLADADVARANTAAAVADAFRKPEVQRLLVNDQARAMVIDADFARLIADKNLRNILLDADVNRLATQGEVSRAFLTPELSRLIVVDNFRAAIFNADFARMIQDKNLRAAITNADFLRQATEQARLMTTEMERRNH